MLISIPYSASQFGGYLAAINGQSYLSSSSAEVLWAALTVGRKNWRHVVRFRSYSYFEIIQRVAMVAAFLKFDIGSGVSRSPAYDALDPTEKGAVSYFIGLTCSKLFSSGLFGVPWLLHLDVYKDVLDPKFNTRSRPDLVGQDASGRWTVIEAKGRTSALPEKLVRKAKGQVASLLTVDGCSPSLRAVVAAAFPSGHLDVVLCDPPGPDDQHSDNEAPALSGKLLRAYYQPFWNLFQDDRARERMFEWRECLFYDIQDVDLAIGLRSELAGCPNDVADRAAWWASQWSIERGSPDRMGAGGCPPNEFIGRDGVAIILGRTWQDLLTSAPAG